MLVLNPLYARIPVRSTMIFPFTSYLCISLDSRVRFWKVPLSRFRSPPGSMTAGRLSRKPIAFLDAIRAKALGLNVMIVFHYSDTWADPGKQGKPAAWAALDFAGLKSALT
ncbi:MAG: hypothetical protein EOP49_22205, partial [Sphingobacteriales bacterium]